LGRRTGRQFSSIRLDSRIVVLADALSVVGERHKSLYSRITVATATLTRRESDSFEELAMPLFDQLYNCARWLTQNREEAEDLVQETYAKALKGFSSFQLGTNFHPMELVLRHKLIAHPEYCEEM
jgi:hypothetical protein